MSASLNLVNLVSEADIVIRFVLFLLLAGSFLSWAIIIDKYIKFNFLRILKIFNFACLIIKFK